VRRAVHDPLLAEAPEPVQADPPRVDREDPGGVNAHDQGGRIGQAVPALAVHAEVVVLEQVPDMALGADETRVDGLERPVVGAARDQPGETAAGVDAGR
jgi:hypothetical protein